MQNVEMTEVKVTMLDRIKMRLQQIRWKDVACRACKTAVQAAAATIAVSDLNGRALIVAAVSAGLSAGWNVIRDVIRREI